MQNKLLLLTIKQKEIMYSLIYNSYVIKQNEFYLSILRKIIITTLFKFYLKFKSTL